MPRSPGPWRPLLEEVPNIKVIGQVPRSEIGSYYKEADVFLFPTLSDGFGLTQLEAQHWKLPIIATKNCGEVVRHGETGFVLIEVDGGSIVAQLEIILRNPQLLAQWTSNISEPDFTLADLGNRLLQIGASSR